MAESNNLVHRLQKSEYTGANRCLPCTIVNILIASCLSITFTTTVGPHLGIGSFAVFLALIYFRGYLIPGTPTLTQQYLPDPILQWFSKHKHPNATQASLSRDHANETNHKNESEVDEIDPEHVLLRADALEPCKGTDDLCLTPTFERAWSDRMHALDSEDYLQELGRVLGRETDGLHIETDDGCLLMDGEQIIYDWESEAALRADLTAAPELADRLSNWDEFDVRTKGQLLQGLRLFLDTCPLDESPLELMERERELCCGQSVAFFTLECPRCDATMAQIQVGT